MELEIELQRYGRNKETQIDSTYIDSGEYRRKFDNITDSDSLNRLIYTEAKKMLKHRAGTEIEDMCWIDAKNEIVLCQKYDETEERCIHHTDKIDKIISSCDNVIAIHTHPHSYPPSAGDFNSFIQCNYKLGIIICHNGKIYAYIAMRYIDELLWEKYVGNEYLDTDNQITSQENALQNFVDNGDIDFWEVTS